MPAAVLLPNATTATARPVLRPSPGVVAAGLIFGTALLNVLYLVADCPLDLAPDEAHYWDWSRHLAWSYYSKGPLVAWLIRAGRELFGPLSVALVGSEMLAVRLPAVGCQALLLAAVYRLAAAALGKPWVGALAVGVAATLPPVTALGVVMTIDAPFLACWAWATVFAHRAAVGGGGRTAWAAAGAVAAVGVLAKYTMLLFPACVGLYLLASPGRRPWGGYALFCGLAACGLLPVLGWNAAHGWVGVRHLLALGEGEPGGLHPLGPLTFGGVQFGLLLGYWFAAWAAAVWAARPGRTRDPHIGFLWWLSAPPWLLFAVASLKSPGQPNWPAPAYVAGMVLAVGWVAARLDRPGVVRKMLPAALGAGVVVALAAHYPAPLRAAFAALLPAPTEGQPAPVRRLDPTSRLAGWRTLAATVDRLRDRVTAEDGQEPVVAGMVWTVPGELAFYCRGNPQVYSVGVALADRHSQYDVWRPNPVADAQVFRDRAFLYVGERMPEMDRVFDRIEPPVEVIASDGGVPVAAWKVWVCHGFKGFPAGDGRRPGY